MEMQEENLLVSESEHLTRKEVLKRRIHYLKKLKKIYHDRYWLLMEDMKNQFRDYYWDHGMSPFEEEGEKDRNASRLCEINGCVNKAMALTKYCHMHIMSDPNQKLYKACNFSIKSSTSGPILCEKPILRSTVPPFCTLHLQRFEKNIAKAFKKAGVNVSSTNKSVPLFHVVIKECTREILKNRRAALKAQMEKVDEKDDISI